MPEIKSRQALQIAATYIGTIVGAGFASGQEILKFFGHYGVYGLIGVGLATCCFIIFGIRLMTLGYRLKANSHREVFNHICGKKLGGVLDILITFFLLGTLSVMLAGSGAIFSEHLALPAWLGIWLTLGLVIVTTFFGLRGVLAVNSFLVPLLVLFVLALSALSLSHHGLNSISVDLYQPVSGAASHWVTAAILYVGYNLILSIAILAPLGGQSTTPQPLILGGLVGGIGLGLLAFVITLVIILHYPQAAQYEIPMLFITQYRGTFFKTIFTFILWSEIFTTLIGTVYGLSARISEVTPLNPRLISILCLCIAALFTNIGFAKLVGIVYPLLGYLSLIFMGGLILSYFRKKGNV